eukprot:GILK01001361.1.p1 GENE.GILK01001361.1~~GILK01001361.1.p1  ORF type:complete len:540 (+),score=59.52 GILK01001361.1:37-1620(+)
MATRTCVVVLLLFVCLSLHLAHAGNANRRAKKQSTARTATGHDAGIDAGMGEVELVPTRKRRVDTEETISPVLPTAEAQTHVTPSSEPVVVTGPELSESDVSKLVSKMKALRASPDDMPPATLSSQSEKPSSHKLKMSRTCKSFLSRLGFMETSSGGKVIPRMYIMEGAEKGGRKKPKLNLNRPFVKVALDTPMNTISGSTLHRIPFYQSSGENSDERDTWFPFNGAVNALMPGKICGYFDKKMDNQVDFSAKITDVQVTEPLNYQFRWLNYELSGGDMSIRYPLPNPEDEEAAKTLQLLLRDKHVFELLLHRWGNLQMMKISALFGGGIWDKGQGKVLKKLFNLRRHACGADFGSVNDVFTALSIGVTDVTFEEANDWIGCDNMYGLHHATVAAFDYNVRFREFFEHGTGSPVNQVAADAITRIDRIDDQFARYYVKPCTPERQSHLRMTLPLGGSLDAISIMLRKVQECERNREDLPREMQYPAEQQLLRMRNQLQCKPPPPPPTATGGEDNAGSSDIRASSEEV